MARSIPTEEEVLGWMTTLSNWGRWGPEDELGTLNLMLRCWIAPTPAWGSANVAFLVDVPSHEAYHAIYSCEPPQTPVHCTHHTEPLHQKLQA
jgi:hypothetical protein